MPTVNDERKALAGFTLKLFINKTKEIVVLPVSP